MPRLPIPGQDNNTWGDILNAYLSVSHAADGTLNPNVVGTNQIQNNAVTNAQLDSVTQALLAKANSSEQTTNKGIASGYAPLDSSSKVPTLNLGGAGADNTKYLRGDQTWVTPAAGVSLDSTATDIQPDTVTGTAVAGATGKAADAGHQHTLVSHDHSSANKGGNIPEASVTNLTTDLAAKATDSTVVHLAGTETITGAKNFTGTLQHNTNAVVDTTDSRLSDTRTPTDGTVTDTKITAGGLTNAAISPTAAIARTKLDSGTQTSLTKADNAIPNTQLGVASGVATLDSTTKLTASQLPGSVANVSLVAASATANATLAAQNFTPCNAAVLALSMALPTGATQGQVIGLGKTDASANTVTYTGSIAGVGSSSGVLVLQGQTAFFIADSSGSWWPVEGFTPVSSLDGHYALQATTGSGAPGSLANGAIYFETNGIWVGTSGSPYKAVDLTPVTAISGVRITKRVVTVTQSATPTINTDNTDVASITALAQAITSMTTNLTGTPADGDTLIIRLTDNGTARAITWGAKFEASGNVALPTTTVISTMLAVGFIWNTVTSAWRCVGVA